MNKRLRVLLSMFPQTINTECKISCWVKIKEMFALHMSIDRMLVRIFCWKENFKISEFCVCSEFAFDRQVPSSHLHWPTALPSRQLLFGVNPQVNGRGNDNHSTVIWGQLSGQWKR